MVSIWTVLLERHQELWLCNLLSDGLHEQPLKEVVEALTPNIFVQFFSLYHGTSLCNTFTTCLSFVYFQSNFRQSLIRYIADVAGTFESLIWLSRRAAWNFRHMFSSCCCLYTLSFFCTPTFSSWYWFLSSPSAFLFSLIAAKVSWDMQSHRSLSGPSRTVQSRRRDNTAQNISGDLNNWRVAKRMDVLHVHPTSQERWF